MTGTEYRDYPCDLCGRDAAEEIPELRVYSGGQPIHVCTHCGFVYVKRRRSAQAIADAWSEEIYGEGYTARIPAVKARQTYVAEFLDTSLGLHGKRVCDVGGGEGQFLQIVRGPDYGAEVFAIEPSAANGALLAELDIPHSIGTVEDYLAGAEAARGAFDVVTIMWTLENCHSCRAMLEAAHTLVKAGGHVLVATGSRILVPFKKPLQYYVSRNPADTHAFRFSRNTLQGILAVAGFEMTHVNRYIDSDPLCMIGRKAPAGTPIPWEGDDYRAVQDFFARWHAETQAHFADV